MKDKEEKLKIEKITRFGIVGSVFLVAVAIFYYLVIYIPQQSKEKIELEKFEADLKITKQKQLEKCLNEAETSFAEFWNKLCKGQGLKDDCSLPTYNADSAKEYLKNWKEDCFKKYPQN